MPDMTFSFTAAQAARIGAALRSLPEKDGTLPAANASNAQVWAHARLVALAHLIATVRSMEAQAPDPELDSVAG